MYAKIVSEHLAGVPEVAVGQVAKAAIYPPNLQESSIEECAAYIASYFSGAFTLTDWKECAVAQLGAIAAYWWSDLLRAAEAEGLVMYMKTRTGYYMRMKKS